MANPFAAALKSLETSKKSPSAPSRTAVKEEEGPAGQEAVQQAASTAGGKRKAEAEADDLFGGGDDLYGGGDDADGLSTYVGGMGMDKKKPASGPVLRVPNLTSDEAQYVLDECIVPNEQLAGFGNVVGGRAVRMFAEQWQPNPTGAARAQSGLQLHGPPVYEGRGGGSARACYSLGSHQIRAEDETHSCR